MTPEQQRIEENAAFLGRALGDRRRVLEVGCGRGAVARELAAQGHEVTALDVALRELVDAPGVRFVECDFLRFDDEPFDAIAFTSSLHHIAPLDAAIARAAQLLAPGGRLIADEFDREAPDVETLRWYYETQELLVAAERLPAASVDEPHADPVARWHHAHHHHAHDHHHHDHHHHHHDHAPLHTGAAMVEAIASRFVIRELGRLEYLYRYLASRLPQDPLGAAIAAHVHATEQRRIADGSLRPVGLRIVADLEDYGTISSAPESRPPP